MGFLRRRRDKRSKTRGAAAVEFALSLFLLIPILFATIDYGYYFWVALHAVEAANAGARAGAPAIVSTTDCTNPGGAAAAGTAAVNTELSKTLMPITAWTSSPAGINQRCIVVSGVPCWEVQVRVDFAPPVAFMLPFMPRTATPPNFSTAPNAGNTRFVTKTVVMPRP